MRFNGSTKVKDKGETCGVCADCGEYAILRNTRCEQCIVLPRLRLRQEKLWAKIAEVEMQIEKIKEAGGE